MQAKSIKGNSPQEIQSGLHQSIAEGFRPRLAIVFMSIKQDRNTVCQLLNEEGIELVGATSCGEFINGYQDQGSIVMLLLDLNHGAYKILFEDATDKDIFSVAKSLSHDALQEFKRPAFILLSTGMSNDGVVFNGEQLIRGIEAEIG